MSIQRSLAYGTFILIVSALVNRVLGFINQIVVVRLIGAEGIGLFNIIFPVYILILVIATAGVPIAISKMVAEEVARGNKAGAHKIFRVAFTILFIASCIVTLAVVLLIPVITTKVITNPKAIGAFVTLIPGVFICAICSAFRGYFQGLSEMVPTAVTQVIEQIVRVCIGLGLAYLLLPKGIGYAAAGLSAGEVCGELIGLLVMMAIYYKKKPNLTRTQIQASLKTSYILKDLFALAFPITISRIISTIILSIDVMLIPQRLQAAGFSLQEATSLYGQLSGMALTLLFIPTVLTFSLATTLVPAISDALAQGNLGTVKGRSGEALWATLIFGLPSLVIFFIIPHQLTDLLFKYPQAGDALRILSLGGIFLYIHQITTGILQGLGKPGKVLLNLVLASLVKIAGIYYLTAIPGLGIKGTAIALILNFMVAALLNVLSIARISGFTLDFRKLIFKPAIALTGMVIIMVIALKIMEPAAGLLTTISTTVALGLGTYFLLLAGVGGITRQDLSRLPYLNRLLR